MKKYQHNPDLFRSHFAGQGLPAFQGQRTQYGYSIGSILKRVAVPLLSSVTELVAPMLIRGSQKAAERAMKKVAPKNKQLQRFVSDGVGKAAALGINRGSRVLKRQSGSGDSGVSSSTKSKRRKRSNLSSVSRDIFN